jgi:protocatechuate 3,4-dioxygenase beta subunit
VQVQAYGFQDTWLGGSAEQGGATVVPVTGDTTFPAIVMPLASTVAGTVTGPGDAPVDGVEVELWRWDDFDEEFTPWSSEFTGDDGHYLFEDVQPGFYTLRFDGTSSDPAVVSAWLEGSSAPTTTTDAGVFSITGTRVDLVKDKTLAGAPVVTGRILSSSADGITGGAVAGYVWDEEEAGWTQTDTVDAASDGTFSMPVQPGAVMTFRFSARRHFARFLGGGSSLPATPDGTNSRTIPSSGDVALGDVTLDPRPSSLGRVAGQQLDYCDDNALQANDDGYSSAVTIPFPLAFFGTPYSQLYVNNNGNVTFNSGRSQYTPQDLTGATNVPIIAPFFADVDTRGAGSSVVTYGASPDGRTFCVNWADVGYYSQQDDKLNTFQLLLTRNDTGAGRGAGDFDITFNYDEVTWETGSASGGTDGFGGTPAAVGFSAGTGAAGTYVQLPGSLTTRALIDGGPNALISGSQGSTQNGRYVFQVRNSGLTSAVGNVTGVVRDSASQPLANQYVQICRTTGAGCSYTDTNASGTYSFTALPAGDYAIRVYPSSDSYFGNGAQTAVVGGQTTTVPPIVLSAPEPMPEAVSLTNNGIGTNGVPSVDYREPLTLVVPGCAGVENPTYTVRLASGQVVRDNLPMTESPAGTYTASITPLSPSTGDAQIATNIPATCGGQPIEFNIYIDPSGIVTDQYGRPIQGATVTLSRSDTENGTYTAVPDGSAIMSPSNRDNPSTTDDTGYFRWDVTAGWYKVTASAAGCVDETTGAMEVPPERIDLVIKMTCSDAAPSPTAPPSVSGTPQVGQTITAVAATWPDPLVSDTVELLRDGESLGTDSHTLTAADVGAVFRARSIGKRPDYVTESGTGSTVSFTAVTALSDTVTGALGVAPANSVKPSVTGSRRVGSTLTANPGAWNDTGPFSYQWLRGGTPIAGATLRTYKLKAADAAKRLSVRVTLTPAGRNPGVATSNPVTISKLASRVSGRLGAARIRTTQRGRLTITLVVAATPRPLGRLTVLDGRRKLTTVTLRAPQKGKVTVTLPRLAAGTHRLVVRYPGSATIAAATARAVVLTVVR